MATVIASALVASLAIALPATAREFKGSGFYGVWDDDFNPRPFRGIVVADRLNGQPRIMISGGAAGRPLADVTFVFRSIGCGGNPSAANRVLKIEAQTDESAQLVWKGLVRNENIDGVRSVRIQMDGDTGCIPVQHFVRVAAGDVNGDGVAAHSGDGKLLGNLLFLGYLDDTDIVMSLHVAGLSGDDAVQLRGVNRPCGTKPTSTYFNVTMDVPESGFQQLVVTTSDIDLHLVRSVRARIGGEVLCAPSIIMANTEGDFH